MKTLKFNVTGQFITLDPSCSEEDLIPGTNGYMQAKFEFSSDWDNCLKVVAFYSNLGREFTPQLLKADNVCDIPSEVLKRSIFKLKVFGKNPNYELCTDKFTVCQRGGNA